MNERNQLTILNPEKLSAIATQENIPGKMGEIRQQRNIYTDFSLAQ
ncbi:hypothetical protein [Nostoc piscinale]|nr:hypothetical protein [Nostoc piscinale]